MRLFKTLFKSCLRDFRKNLKQFIAIVFILGIAVVLFTGLNANSIAFENRVNQVYSSENGNLADIWVTLNTDMESDSSDDLVEIEKFIGDDGKMEERTLIPSSVNNFACYSLISIDRPTINKEYDTEYDNTNENLDKDFFFVDEGLIAKYESAKQETVEVGDILPLTFDLSTIGSLKDVFVDSFDGIADSLKDSINKNDDLSLSEKVAYIKFINDNKDGVIRVFKEVYERIFSADSLTLNIKISGIMKHPENIQNGTFSNSNLLLGGRTLINSILDKVGDSLNYDDLLEFVINSSIADQYKEDIINELKKYEETFNVFKYVQIEDAKQQVLNDENNQYVNELKRLYNQIVIKAGKDKNHDDIISDIKNYYSTTYPDTDKIMAILKADNYPSNAVIQNDIVQSRNLNYTFPILFFVVAILVVITTITQMMLKQRIQIGTMKGLGISKKNILLYYLFYMNIIGVVGVIFGAIIGPLVLPIIMNIKYDILYTLPALSYVFPWTATIVCLIGVVVCISLITYFIIRKELSYVPAESMRAKVVKMKVKQNKNKKDTKYVSLMMALRNIHVHFSRSLMVVIGVMGCTGLLICGMGIEDVIDFGKVNDLGSYLDCDYTISYSAGVRKGEKIDTLLSIDGVEAVDEYTQLTTTLSFNDKNIDVPIYYFSKDSEFFKFDDKYEGGHWDLDSVALSESKADELGVKEGDTVSFSVGGTKYEKVVDKIFYTFANNSLFIYFETIPELSKTVLNAWLNVKKDGNGKFLVDEKVLEENLLAIDGVSSLVSRTSNDERIENYMTSIRSMTNTIKAFALLLAVIVLINLAMLNFEERSRDIATLRVLGFSKWKIARSLIYEVMFLTVIGALLGLLLGLPFEYMVLSINITPIIAWHYLVYPASYVLSFLISSVTALAVNIAISYRVDKINMAESLKSIE